MATKESSDSNTLTRVLTVLSCLLLAAAFFLLPAGTKERIGRTGRLFLQPGVELSAATQRVAREALGGLPENMTVAERDALLAELAKARNDIASRDAKDEALRVENRQLQRFLRHVRQTNEYSLVVAEVLGRQRTPEEHGSGVVGGTLRLDRGAADGVCAGQAVLTLDGVVGVVTEAMQRQCVVQLLTSKEFSVAADVTAKQTSGILERRGEALWLTLPMGPAFDSLLPGEVVHTSNLGNDEMVPGLLWGTLAAKERAADDSPIYQVRPASSTAGTKYFLIAIPGRR